MSERVLHTIDPVFDERSRVLVLGTMPSPKSRAAGFYYAHPQNRFWSALAAAFGEETPNTTQERRDFALAHRVALWDVLQSCDIEGAADGSIKNPVPNDVAGLLRKTEIAAVFTTGQTAGRLYRQLCQPQTGLAATVLPSSSPANRACSFERLAEAYRSIALAAR